MLNRREFLTSTGSGIVTLLLTPILAACGSDDSGGTSTSVVPTTPTPTGCDGAGETSTEVDGHTHTLCVPASDLTSPPAGGATYSTSIDAGHDHAVSLSQAQLTTVENGGSVNVTTTTVSGHTHGFSVRRTPVASSPIPSPAMRYPMY